MAADIKLSQALQDPRLFGGFYQGESWDAWKVIAQVLDGLGLSPGEQEIYQQITGRQTLPGAIRELWCVQA